MKRWAKEETQVKILFVVMILVLVAVILPLFWISRYNFRSVDDFGYAKTAESMWEENHSLFEVLVGQVSYTIDYYQSWQGSFFDVWLVIFLMGIIDEKVYFFVTVLSLGGFVLTEAFTFWVIFKKVLHADTYRSGIVTAGCVSLQILLTPVPSEGYFWFSGAIRYTFIHGLGLLLIALLILLYQAEKGWRVVALESLALLLSIAVGGSNYITGLTVLLLYCLSVFWVFYRKHPRKWIFVINTVLYVAVFLLNVLAPGNQNRQSASGTEHMPAIRAMFASLKEAAVYIGSNTILPCMILGLLFLPLFISIVKRNKYKYPFPVLVSVLSFGVFAAQFVPNMYALGILGAGRVLNLYRWNLYLLLFGNELYWTGWVMRSLSGDWKDLDTNKEAAGSYLLGGWCLGGILLCFSLSIWGGTTLTSVSAMTSLRDGTAKVYYQEHQERLKLLEDDSIQQVYLKPFTYKPYVLFFGDVQEDPEDWVNQSMAGYFGKEAIMLQE